MSTPGLNRFEGRLFAEDGRLFLVVRVDAASDTARVSCRLDGVPQVIDMPLGEVAKRVSAGADLVLDNLNGADSSKRVVRKQDGWFFSAREGLKGPFRTSAEAERQLSRYIVAAQSRRDRAAGEPRRAQPAP